eukprot:TRINITY_DN2284_c0_g1::TRINITY_DN2284_c0_g1_i1::g.6734::m.6734 TRINITY_DN2284_c0_g1::TRINITY_DN2284_c0_g1_i1::g.6734  ORF type:complete len:215 (-),score=52.00,sp/Q94C69/CSP3_ARATH/31.42/5e-28,sp/Q94C69/CSP3_ARATH/41.10/3e-06,CSD/PF00313.17/5.4e-24,zf-CCHC/PF00098.18/1.2e-07,zf-CCHC/PF00098.18/1.2e-07,zf-CCHC/PF00098.18/0.00084,zf-CCHC_4/PF14392.1/1.1,zf-CCHC_4/PF14392.1/0.4,zf-CCHC_4/PF14392.1/0.39,zf-CCHC_2/PF13696.1/0.32,zf-CCHC_2/PF13696.1/0.43,zf-CCHC_2/PF13696.1/4.9,OB_RNB/PF08206.6/0.03,zf
MSKQVGSVKWFSSRRGYGYINPDDGSEAVFVHQTAIQKEGFRSLREGEKVEYELSQDESGRSKAVNVSGPNGVDVEGAPRFPRTSRGRGRGRGGRTGRGGRAPAGERPEGAIEGEEGEAGRGRGRGGRGRGRRFVSGLCYNCQQRGHLARDCTAEKRDPRCYNCGKTGHLGKDCTEARSGEKRCYDCGEVSHLARDCPARQQ